MAGKDTDKNISSSTPSTSEIRDRRSPNYTFSTPSAQEIRENRNTIVKILDTLKTLEQIRSRNEVPSSSASSRHCPCTKRSMLDADIKYLQELMRSSGFRISRADCEEAYQEGDMVKFAKDLHRTLIKAEGVDVEVHVDKKRQKVDAVESAIARDEMDGAAKREAILKAVRWMQSKNRSRYSFDRARSEFSVLASTVVEPVDIGDVEQNVPQNLIP